MTAERKPTIRRRVPLAKVTARKLHDGKTLHVEAPGCIVNIRINLVDQQRRAVTFVEIIADGDRYAGSDTWWLEGEAGANARTVRVIQTERAK